MNPAPSMNSFLRCGIERDRVANDMGKIEILNKREGAG